MGLPERDNFAKHDSVRTYNMDCNCDGNWGRRLFSKHSPCGRSKRSSLPLLRYSAQQYGPLLYLQGAQNRSRRSYNYNYNISGRAPKRLLWPKCCYENVDRAHDRVRYDNVAYRTSSPPYGWRSDSGTPLPDMRRRLRTVPTVLSLSISILLACCVAKYRVPQLEHSLHGNSNSFWSRRSSIQHVISRYNGTCTWIVQACGRINRSGEWFHFVSRPIFPSQSQN